MSIVARKNETSKRIEQQKWLRSDVMHHYFRVRANGTGAISKLSETAFVRDPYHSEGLNLTAITVVPNVLSNIHTVLPRLIPPRELFFMKIPVEY